MTSIGSPGPVSRRYIASPLPSSIEGLALIQGKHVGARVRVPTGGRPRSTQADATSEGGTGAGAGNRMDRGESDAGGETRTPDTRIMIPLL